MNIYIRKRPFVDEFLTFACRHFEVIIFTASLGEVIYFLLILFNFHIYIKYASKVIEKLDPNSEISYNIYRENCTPFNGMLVKDLSKMNRDLKDTIIVDV